jgi:AraC family transcriptional regulator
MRSSVQVTQSSDLVRKDSFSVAGLMGRFDQTTRTALPKLWDDMLAALPFPGMNDSWETYGLVWDTDPTSAFSYLAGAGLNAGAEAPPGFKAKTVAAATYAVFHITLGEGAVQPQLTEAFETIWGEMMPASKLRVADAPAFEFYGGDFRPKAGAVLEFHIPVEV